MRTANSTVVWTVGLMSVSVAALASDPKPAPPQEPAGFIAGGVIGGLAAGPVGAVIGAGVGTWLGNRVHRAGEAKKAEAQVAALETDKRKLESDKLTLETDKLKLETDKAALVAESGDLSETNRALTARLDQVSHGLEAVQPGEDGGAGDPAAKVLDGLQGDVLFRTNSAEISPEMTKGIQVLAEAVAKSPTLKVRVDGFADPRGTAEANLKLSRSRAEAVRDLFLAAGVPEIAVEVTAYGKTLSVAGDSDGFALERRVRLTLQAEGGQVAQAQGGSGPAQIGSTGTAMEAAPRAAALKVPDKE